MAIVVEFRVEVEAKVVVVVTEVGEFKSVEAVEKVQVQIGRRTMQVCYLRGLLVQLLVHFRDPVFSRSWISGRPRIFQPKCSLWLCTYFRWLFDLWGWSCRPLSGATLLFSLSSGWISVGQKPGCGGMSPKFRPDFWDLVVEGVKVQGIVPVAPWSNQ